jgi:DNA gyrase subunit B
MAKTVDSEYTADDITALEGLDAVRKRPGMYIGSTDSRGLIHLVWEIFDNSVDEALAGHCTRIDVTLHDDGSVEVADNGRGIPVDVNTKTGKTGLELCLTSLHAGGKFGGKAFAVSGGLHGVGASVTNALSTRLDALVMRDGKNHEMSFQRGVPGVFSGDNADGKFTTKNGLRSSGKVAKGVTGTSIRFWPDRGVFMSEAVIDPELVAARLDRTAYLVPGLTVTLNIGGAVRGFQHDGGLVDMVESMASGTPLAKPFLIEGTGVFTENVPVIGADGNMVMTELERSVAVSVALLPSNGYDNDTKGFVNVVSTPGGTHIRGFEAGILKWVRDGVTLKAKDEQPVVADALEGLYAVVSVQLPEPQFEGQTKEILGTKAVQAIVRDVTVDGLSAWAKGRGNAQAAKTWLGKVVIAANIRAQARESRDTQRRKTALEGGSNLPAKLVDCRSRDNSELIIVEGDSALGTAKAGRYASHQALLPIRGKILNAQKATVKAVFDNTECAAIIQCIGAGSGKTFDVEAMRYERIILMADADVDGAHIRTLLITLFWQQMRPLVLAGRLYSAVPPLHHVKTKGRTPQEFFTYTQEEMELKVQSLEAAGETVVKPVQRFKGLGEMSATELRQTTLDPSTRTLRQITADDVVGSETMLELLMGSVVEPRRDYIVANTRQVDL